LFRLPVLWKISEIKRESPRVLIYDDLGAAAKSIETAYVVVKYPVSREAPLIWGQYRLQQTILGIRFRDGLVSAFWHVEEGAVELPGSRAELAKAETIRQFIYAAGYRSRNPQLITNFVTSGGDVNLRDEKGNPVLTLLVANEGSPELIRLLIQHGANVNAINFSLETPLDWAVFKGRTDIVSMLLQARANPNAQNADGDTPLMLAIQACSSFVKRTSGTDGCNADIKIIEQLRAAGADPNILNKKSESPQIVIGKMLEPDVEKSIPARDRVAARMERALAGCGKTHFRICG
jgi:hypothetical protein